MNSSHTQDCQNLCMERKEEGCCYINDQFGCYWKEKEDVSPMDPGTGMAIRCSVSGIKVEPFYSSILYLNSCIQIYEKLKKHE